MSLASCYTSDALLIVLFTDDLIERTRQALSFKSAKDRNELNLRTWIGSFGCISREETKYLWGNDVMSVGPSDPDEFLDTVGSLLEDFIIWLSEILNIVRQILLCPCFQFCNLYG